MHCIGIGGIGLSALARYFHALGVKVTGSNDGVSTRILEDLEKEGIVVHTGSHDASYVEEGTDLVIYSIAVRDTNPELRAARTRGITCMTYPEALGVLTKEYTTIAVCGTHGKTTTTAMVASMLKACGKNPTVIVGSLLSDGGSNFIQGDSEYLVVEACEYRRSFLNLHPTHIIVTNIDEDHLDYYKDLADIQSAFQSFADTIPHDGYLVTHSDVTLTTKGHIVTTEAINKEEIELSVLGEHNKKNASLALMLAKSLNLDEVQAREGLKAFSGTWRRLEYKGTQTGAFVYDDYGHHPKEIEATLQALRERYASPKFKLIVVFQPHLYSRTKLLLDDFSQAFTLADTVCILPIYAAREVDDGTISSHDLVEKTHNAIYMETFDEVKKYLDKKAHSGSVVLTLGAGDVYLLCDSFITEKKQKTIVEKK